MDDKSENNILSLDGKRSMHFDEVSSRLFGPSTEISYNFTVVESFDNPNGKFGDNLGNAAIIDCKYIDELFEDKSSQFKEFLDDMPQVDFCNYAMSIAGVLKDQVSVYTRGQKNMRSKLAISGDELIDTITFDANITASTPL